MIERELKKCPFCGADAEIKTEYREYRRAYYTVVKCSRCYAQSRMYKTLYDPKVAPVLFDIAEDNWNRRVNVGDPATE